MKTLKTIACLLLSLSAAQCFAQTTNLVQNISVHLHGLRQGRTVTNGHFVSTDVDRARVDTRQVIQTLGTAMGQTFSSSSRLVLVTRLDSGASMVQVRDGAADPVDVTGYVEIQPQSESVFSSHRNLRTGRALEVDYYVLRFVLRDLGEGTLPLQFDVSGVAIGTSFTTQNRSGTEVMLNASGSGSREGNLLILEGRVNISGGTLEVEEEFTGQT